jgi:hypothetical protein
MRIGEVVVFGTSNQETENFIDAVCQNVVQKDKNICFGSLEINEQLVLYLYGMTIGNQLDKIAWEMFSNKVLGYLIIFNWHQPESLSWVLHLLDYLAHFVGGPLVVAADVTEPGFPMPLNLMLDGITLNPNEKLVFCQKNDPASCKKTMITLLDIVIDHVS